MIYQHRIASIGSFHLNHCEDDTLCVSIGQDRLLLAVLDGCTMGDDSHFAATLFARLLRKIAKHLYYQDYLTSQTPVLDLLMRELVGRLFEELVQIKNSLQLERNEILSTVLLAILDCHQQAAVVFCLGDGVVQADGKMILFDQENQPDYLAYHLGKSFDQWYAQQDQCLTLSAIQDLSLCSDGILTFVDQDGQELAEDQLAKVRRELLIETEGLDNDRFLLKKLYRLEQAQGWTHTDDLGIVRVVID